MYLPHYCVAAVTPVRYRAQNDRNDSPHIRSEGILHPLLPWCVRAVCHHDIACVTSSPWCAIYLHYLSLPAFKVDHQKFIDKVFFIDTCTLCQPRSLRRL